ncbi:PREDICTED: cytoskeleton-associated protein 5-like isoform X1 [Branchiostoma belcheri]|uniref:Cytoskeleton-associated protein 5-like isoform X1 n=1 Tax=Branchiostoma belcheri TaxID=7741 RepID=A0A6P4Z0I0_BRABE|nr:PREDICTED: cytoskeleton-associated protein 5-like isoform X1 [Branchiostoma belcheri]
MADDDSEWRKLPTDDKCVHKVWKARVAGYEEATKLFKTQKSEKSPEFAKYLGLVKKFVTDNNAIAQEKGLDAVLAFVENAADAKKTAGEVIPGIVTKVLNARPKTKEKGVEICMMYIEIERQDIVQEEIMKGFTNKQPKVVAACIQVLTEGLRCYGNKIMPIKPVVKTLPPLLEHKDKAVREEAKQLSLEIYRWIGPAFTTALQGVKPVVMKELEEEWEKLPKKPARQTRFLRSQQDLKAKMEAEENGEEEEDEGDDDDNQAQAEIDPYELLDPVEILSKIPKDFQESMESKKWQIRKEALDALHKLTSNPKLEAGDYGDIVRILIKTVGKDSNVMLVTVAGNCMTGLANGLRKKFSPYAVQCVKVILEKFKEKKVNVVTSLREAIDAIYLTTNLQAISEDYLAALDNKNPSIKAETALFLTRCLKRCTPAQVPKAVLKPMCASLVSRTGDTAPDVREAAFEAIGTAMRVVGEKPIAPFLAELDQIKMGKIKDYSEKAEIIGGGKKTKPKEKEPAAAKEPPKKSGGPPSAWRKGSSSGPPKASASQRPSTAPAKAKGGAGKAKGKKGAASSVSDKPEFQETALSDEEVAEKAAELFSAETLKQLDSANWKERLAGMEDFSQAVKTMEPKTLPCQVIIKTVAKKGWKENNFQVLIAKFQLVKYVAENGKISQGVAKVCLTGLTEKVGDIKGGAVAKEALTALAEATTLDYVSQGGVELAFKQKNPKNQAEILNWLNEAIKEFGLKVSVKPFIQHMKTALAATNPAIRTAGINLIGVLSMYMGAQLRVFFEDEKPALLQQIDAEIEKMSGEKPPAPTRGVRKRSEGEEGGEEEGEEEEDQAAAINIEDLVPRTDVSERMRPELMNELGDKNWKVRKEALEKVSAILEEAKFITPSLGDLPSALKARLGDSNKILVMNTLTICTTIATAMGPNIRQHVSVIGPGILQTLGDSKEHVRQAGLAALNAVVEQTGVTPFMENEMMSDALRSTSPMLKIELFGWLAEKLMTVKTCPPDLVNCLPMLYASLEDRNADVRKNAQGAVVPFMYHLGYEKMNRAVGKLAASSKTNVSAILEKARAEVPAKPSKKGKGKASSPPSDEGSGGSAETRRPKTAPAKSKREEDSGSAKEVKQAEPAAKSGRPKSGIAKANANKGGMAGSKKKGSNQSLADEDTGPPLILNNEKKQRIKDEKTLKVLKWNFSSPESDHIEQLQKQLTTCVSKTIYTQFFHSDFKRHLAAMDTLIAAVKDQKEETVAQLDLLLKWITLRFFDTNTTVNMKALEYLTILFNTLAEDEYRLLDIEANSFLPYLVIKVGDSKDVIRRDVRAILKIITKVYPASKIFPFLMDGVRSKNAKQRAECIEELGCLIEGYGLNVCQPTSAKALKEIATQIGDRDNGVRNATLNTLVQAYAICGEQLFKFVGKLTEKDQSMLEERIKRSGVLAKQAAGNRPTTAPPKISPGGMEDGQGDVKPGSKEEKAISQLKQLHRQAQQGRPQTAQYKREFTLDLDTIEGEEVTVSEPVLVDTENTVRELLEDPVNLPETRMRPPSPSMALLGNTTSSSSAVDYVISQVASSEVLTSVQALAQLDAVIQDEEKYEAITDHVDQLLIATLLQLRMAMSKHSDNYDSPEAQDIIKTYRCVLATLIALFQTLALASQASKDVLRDLFSVLITLLLDEHLPHYGDGPQVIRSVNVLVVKVIEKSDLTNCLGALIKLLHGCVASETSAPKFTDLTMKCIWKTTKMFPSVMSDMDINMDKVLLDLHNFMKAFPTATWKDRPSDMPLRTIKTVLHLLAMIKREKIFSHMTLIDNPQDSEVEGYLKRVLKSSKGKSSTGQNKPKHNEQMNGTAEKEEAENMPEQTSKPTPRKMNPRTNDMLAEIFKKIGNKENTKEGLADLYDFKKKHPEADITPFMQRTSQFFQNYIERGLKNIELEREGKIQPGTAVSHTENQFQQGDNLPLAESSGSHDNRVSMETDLATSKVIQETMSSATSYRERLKILRQRCGLENSAGDGPLPHAPPVSSQHVDRSKTAKDYPDVVPSPSESQLDLPPSILSGPPLDVPQPASISANVDDLKRRLERIKKSQSHNT